MFGESRYGHMTQEYYVRRVREAMARRAEERAAVRTRKQALELRKEVRRKLRRCFGPMPKRTPLNARVTGVAERKGYVIENVTYESRPGLHVTANLYVPTRGESPWPCVLGACGHSGEGKGCDLYQAFSRNLALQGYVVLIYDPLSQGERVQYSRRDAARPPKGCCAEHNMMGKQMGLCGDFFGLWRVWDGMRGLDYLLARPETDAARVGVTGNSGGGTLTTYLTALDRRFTMAAPSCFVTSFLSNLENELPADSEQIPPGMIAEGLDMADYFVAHMPRPTLLLGQRNDYFDVRGLEAQYEELRRLYGLLGAEDDVRLFVGPEKHGYSVHNRQAMYAFFNEHASVDGSARERRADEAEPLDVLSAAPRGQVSRLGGRRVFDFTRERAEELAADRAPRAGADLSRRVRKVLGLPRRAGVPHYRALRQRPHLAGGRLWHSAFGVETEQDIQAVLHLFMEEDYRFFLPEAKRVTLYVPNLSSADEVAGGKAPATRPLFAVDVRGIGESLSRCCGTGPFFEPYGREYFHYAQALFLNEPLLGRRVHDVLSVLDLFEAKGCESVHLVGRGLGSVWGAYASLLHPLVKKATLHNAPLSYHELTQTPLFEWPESTLPYGVLGSFDLPDVYRELAAKGLTLVDPWDARMRRWEKRAARSRLKELGLAGLRVRWT